MGEKSPEQPLRTISTKKNPKTKQGTNPDPNQPVDFYTETSPLVSPPDPAFSVPSIFRPQIEHTNDARFIRKLNEGAILFLKGKGILDDKPLDFTKVGSVGWTLLELAYLTGGIQQNWLFEYAIPKLVEIEMVTSADDLESAIPEAIGNQLLILADIAKRQTGTLLYMGLPILLEAGLFTRKELKQKFQVLPGNWLESFGKITVDGGEHVWTVFQYAIKALVEAKIIQKEHIDEHLRYAPKLLAYELARLPEIVGGGWDYYQSMMPDALTGLKELTPEAVAEFIRETSKSAGDFYASGQDMLWRTKVHPFRTFLPMDDPSFLLSAIAELKRNPASPKLIRWLEEKRDWRLLTPRNSDDIKRVSDYSQFLLTLTQRGEDQTKYLAQLNFADLGNYREATPAQIMEVVDQFNIIQPKSSDRPGLGDRWLKESKFDVAAWKEKEVEVNMANIDDIYARFYILKRNNPKILEGIRFKWVNGIKNNLAVGDLARLILTSHRLREIFGADHNPLDGLIRGIQSLKLDFSLENIPTDFFEVKGLELVRNRINQTTGNRGGDEFVMLVDLAVTTAPMEKVGLENMILAMRGWLKVEQLDAESEGPKRDIQGRYLLFASHAAVRVRDYFELHPEELEARRDKEELLRFLRYAQSPIRPLLQLPDEIILNKPASPRLVGRSKPKNIPAPASKVEAKVDIKNPLLVWLEGAENNGAYLSDPRLKEIRLDDPATFGSLKVSLAAVADKARIDRLINQIYERYFRSGISVANAELYYEIARGILDQSDNFYHPWGYYVGSQLVQLMKKSGESVCEAATDCEAMLAWLEKAGFKDKRETLFSKGVRELKAGRFGYIFNKIGTKVTKAFSSGGAAEIGDARKGEIKRQKVSGNLPGFIAEKLHIDGSHQATLIIGDHKKGARAAVHMNPGGGISGQSLEKRYDKTIQYQGPVLMVSGQNKGVEVMIEKGEIKNFVYDPNRLHGYLVIFPDGHLKIVDKRRLRLSDFTENSKDRSVILDLNNPFDFQSIFQVAQEKQLSMMASLFFENKPGENYTKGSSGADSRRFVVDFGDGRFGVIDSAVDMSINDLLHIAWRIGAVRTLYCDTGMFDNATYYTYDSTGRRNSVTLGHRDDDRSSNRLVFYQGE